jgi:hypothetical protein
MTESLNVGSDARAGPQLLLYFVTVSHSIHNDDLALALKVWLIRAGKVWLIRAGEEEDLFLDLDSKRGIVVGQRWARALEEAATPYEAVLFLVPRMWLALRCGDEYQLANRHKHSGL